MKIFEKFQKGINLGGWISQFDKYSKEHFDSFITEKDIEYIAGLSLDHVRVPVDYNVLEDERGNLREDGFVYLDNCRNWCEKYGLNMLIDLHECFGYSFDPLKKDMDRTKFFYDKDLQKRFFDLWRKIAEHFAPYTDRVAFEPLNEVVPESVVEPWNNILEQYMELIRGICPTVYIVAGGVVYNNVKSVPLLDIPYDDRLVYNFHCYDPFKFTHQGAYWVEDMPSDFRTDYEESPEFFEKLFEPALEKAEKDNVALYCGEYGVIDLADNRGKLKWLKDIHTAFNKHHIGHALWNYKEKDFGLVDERFEEIKEDFIQLCRSDA